MAGEAAPAGTVDLWVNLVPPDAGAEFLAKGYGIDPGGAVLDDVAAALVQRMDACGVGLAVLTCGLEPPDRAARAGLLTVERLVEIADRHAGRFLVSAVVDRPQKPVLEATRVRELAASGLSLVRVVPLLAQIPLNDRLLYPVYAVCAELGLPVSVNVGIPGPRVRSACQHPSLLEDLLVDFPGLAVIGAHMGHPYEELLLTYMRKWRDLYLATTAYLPTYLDERVVAFMRSSQGRGRVVFGSDDPFLPMERAVAAARALPLDDEAAAEYLGGAARRLLVR